MQQKSSLLSLGLLAGVFAIGAVYACGGDKPAPATPSNPPSDSANTTAASASSAAASVASSATPAPSSSAPLTPEQAEAQNFEDINEKNHEKDGPIEMTVLVPKNAPKSTWPKATTGDHDCLSNLSFTGKHKEDYDALVAQCGTPTGMVKYVEPAEGALHAKHDKRDVFSFEVRKGMCYRYFAVADNGIADIDILVQKPTGALLATDKTTQPIAVINSSEPWCITDYDQKLHFAVEVDGHGAGKYMFGVWARPAK